MFPWLHKYLSSVKPHDGTPIKIHTVFLAENTGGSGRCNVRWGMVGVFCRLEIARSKGKVAPVMFFFSTQELYFKFQPELICLLWCELC